MIDIRSAYITNLYEKLGRKVRCPDHEYEYMEYLYKQKRGGYTIPINYKDKAMCILTEGGFIPFQNTIGVKDLDWGDFIIFGFFRKTTGKPVPAELSPECGA